MASYSSKPFLKQPAVLYTLIFTTLVNISLFGLIFFQTDTLQSRTALHYNIYFGIDLLGPWYELFTLAFLGLAILIVNTAVAVLIYHYEKILSYILVGAAFFSQLLLLVATMFIISLNI